MIAGLWGYYYFSDAAQVLRVLMVLGGLLAAAGVAWFTAPGKELFAFGQEVLAARRARCRWPTRKETLQTTLVVFAFVVIMALFLFAIDTSLAWMIKMLTGKVE